jgi:hypothetical protein
MSNILFSLIPSMQTPAQYLVLDSYNFLPYFIFIIIIII